MTNDSKFQLYDPTFYWKTGKGKVSDILEHLSFVIVCNHDTILLCATTKLHDSGSGFLLNVDSGLNLLLLYLC